MDFLDELEAIWGERGGPGIGRLRKVAMTPPLEVELLDPLHGARQGSLRRRCLHAAPKTRALFEAEGVEVIEVEYDEVTLYGGGVRCSTMQLVREPGPKVFA